MTENAEQRCENGAWLIGECDNHGSNRFRYVPCKKRNCEVCGPIGRYRISERIALGIRQFWPCAWLVLTFAEDIEKKQAVRRLGDFIKWLRKISGKRLEYAATYELTRRGRLHINLIIGPWKYIEQAKLQEEWKARVSVEWVKDEAQIGKETAKAYSPEGLGGYLTKLEQVVPTDRRCSFSKHWPKLPKGGLKRKGKVRWTPAEWEANCDKLLCFTQEKLDGYWSEASPGEWKSITESCDCFDLDTS